MRPYPYDHDRYSPVLVPREIALLEHVICQGLGNPRSWKAEFDGSIDLSVDLVDVARRFKLALFEQMLKEQGQLPYLKRDCVVLIIEDVIAYLHRSKNRNTEEGIFMAAVDLMIESMKEAMSALSLTERSLAWSATWALHACSAVGSAHLVAKFANQATGRAVSMPDPPRELWQAEDEAKRSAWSFYADTLLNLMALAPCKSPT